MGPSTELMVPDGELKERAVWSRKVTLEVASLRGRCPSLRRRGTLGKGRHQACIFGATAHEEGVAWMSIRHLLTLADVGEKNLRRLVEDGLAIAAGRWDGHHPLRDKVVGIYFKKTSTRTRTSFTVGAMKLGASTISYGPNDLQLATGETLSDTARVLANYLDVLVVRTNEPLADMRQLAAQER